MYSKMNRGPQHIGQNRQNTVLVVYPPPPHSNRLSCDGTKDTSDHLTLMMDTNEPLPKSSLPIHQLSIRKAFDGLTSKEKLYAHYLARAAWSGTKIILRQVSPESIDIFDFIMEIYRYCQESFSGQWTNFSRAFEVTEIDIGSFLEYAASFLSNVGNYYVRFILLRLWIALKIL